MDTDDALDPRDATWTYQWGVGGGEFGCRNRLRLPYGEPVTVTTDLGTWTVETAGLPTTPIPAAS